MSWQLNHYTDFYFHKRRCSCHGIWAGRMGRKYSDSDCPNVKTHLKSCDPVKAWWGKSFSWKTGIFIKWRCLGSKRAIYRNCQSQGKRISALTIRFLIFQKYLNVFTAEILHILHRLAEVESDFPLPGQLWKHMADRSVPAMLMKKSFSGFCFKTKPW